MQALLGLALLAVSAIQAITAGTKDLATSDKPLIKIGLQVPVDVPRKPHNFILSGNNGCILLTGTKNNYVRILSLAYDNYYVLGAAGVASALSAGNNGDGSEVAVLQKIVTPDLEPIYRANLFSTNTGAAEDAYGLPALVEQVDEFQFVNAESFKTYFLVLQDRRHRAIEYARIIIPSNNAGEYAVEAVRQDVGKDALVSINKDFIFTYTGLETEQKCFAVIDVLPFPTTNIIKCRIPSNNGGRITYLRAPNAYSVIAKSGSIVSIVNMLTGFNEPVITLACDEAEEPIQIGYNDTTAVLTMLKRECGWYVVRQYDGLSKLLVVTTQVARVGEGVEWERAHLSLIGNNVTIEQAPKKDPQRVISSRYVIDPLP